MVDSNISAVATRCICRPKAKNQNAPFFGALPNKTRSQEMAECRITSNGRITIPAEFRQRLGLAAGHRVVFTRLLDGTVVMRAKVRSVNDLNGLIQPSSATVEVQIEDMNLGKE